MLYSPVRVAIAGVAAWIILFLVSPLQIKAPVYAAASTYIILCYLALFGGCWLFNLLTPFAQLTLGRVWEGRLSIRTYWFSFMLGLASVIIRLYDRIYIRGIDYSLNEVDIRERLIETGGSIYGALSSLLQPFAFLPLILLLASKYKPSHTPLYALAFVTFCFPMLDSLQILSRSMALVTAMLFFSAWVCLKCGGRILRTRAMLPAVIGVIGFILFSSTIFVNRLQDMDLKLSDSIVESGYAYTVAPNRIAMENIIAGSGPARTLYGLLVPNSQYYLHGFFEFGLLFNRPDGQSFGYGSYTVYPYTRALSIILDERYATLDDSIMFYRPGVYVTFFGSWWVDFGWIGIIIMLPVGYFMSSVAARAKRGDFRFLPLHMFHLTILFYMPVSNFLTSGTGFYLWHGFALFALFGKSPVGSDGDFERRLSRLSNRPTEGVAVT